MINVDNEAITEQKEWAKRFAAVPSHAKKGQNRP
jgi:hypothetical protein